MQTTCDPASGALPSDDGRDMVASPVVVEDPLAVADWDVRVAEHPEATVFHTAGWARTLVDTYGFVPRYLTRRSGGSFADLLPLMRGGNRVTRTRLVALPFTDGCPPLVRGSEGMDVPPPTDPTAGSATVASFTGKEPLLSAAIDLARSESCRWVEFRDCATWLNGIAPSVTFYGHTIPLSGGVDALMERCSPSMRRALRKAERSPLRLKEGRDLADVQAYYDLHCRTRRRHGLPPQPFEFFRHLQRHLLQQGHGFVVLAMDGSAPVAGALFLGFGKKALYKFGASTETHLEYRPNNWVLWQGIRRCAELGYATLDLGRTSLDNQGLRRFKLGLGGEERLMAYVRYDWRIDSTVVARDRSKGWHSGFFRALPLSLNRALGEILYRHMT